MYSDITRIWIGDGFVEFERTLDTGWTTNRRFRLNDRRALEIENWIARLSFEKRVWMVDVVIGMGDLFIHIDAKEHKDV